MRNLGIFRVSLLCYGFVYLPIVSISCLNSDGFVLLSLLKHFDEVPVEVTSTWKNNTSDTTPCNNWFGVVCDHSDNVKWLSLNDSKISGQLGSEIGELKSLVILDLSGNNFSGVLPSSLENCSSLGFLDLSSNGFSGEIPSSLGNLRSLNLLYLSSNFFSGSLPESLFQLPLLEVMHFESNHLSGRIPASVGGLKELQALTLTDNKISGHIPSSLGMLKKIVFLDLSYNRLSGNIPQELGNCSSLDSLMLSDNQLQGEIPPALGNLKKLRSLDLSVNKLSGEIPISVWKIRSLTQMFVSQNILSGELPVEVTDLTNLMKLSLFSNNFYGDIPMNLGLNRSLEVVDLGGNNFIGEIPPNLCHGQMLTIFNLDSNKLHGMIPASIRQCKTLERVRLEENNLSGVIPEFPESNSLYYVNLTSNNFEGSIPSSLGSCKNLATIDLSHNKFTGLIPAEFGNLYNLGLLDLSHNHLEGFLPSQLSGCANILRFDVGSNSLNGSVPSSFRSWRLLETLILSENQFTGAIPQFLAELDHLSDLRVARNGFGGEIPSTVGLLKSLRYCLDLSGNGFTGKIPAALGDLISLEWLNLSNNKLTGSLSVLQPLSSLIQVDVSYNQFTGPIPEKLISDQPPIMFLGNPGLCIQPSSSANAPTRNAFKSCKGQAKHSTWKIGLIAAGSSMFILVLLFVLILVFLRSKRGDAHDLIEEEGMSLLLNKVLAATENLDDKYIIGRGVHGVVYRATLGSGKEYAVKKLLFAEHANENMRREIETIGLVRHRNLIRLERFWMRKEDGLMLYQYMPNGSLHDVLHRDSTGETVLDWLARFNIALGIAHGLAYLHHDCFPPIIHRDIKLENILLDSDMEPHIGDFGLARILNDSTVSTTTITGTTGYISPENAYKTVRSKESDVYSYGVVLLELVTGKRALDRSLPEDIDIVSWVRFVLSSNEDDDDTGAPIIDPRLVHELLDMKLREQAIQVTYLALRCTDKRPENRPSMRDVVKELTDVRDLIRNTSSSVC